MTVMSHVSQFPRILYSALLSEDNTPYSGKRLIIRFLNTLSEMVPRVQCVRKESLSELKRTRWRSLFTICTRTL